MSIIWDLFGAAMLVVGVALFIGTFRAATSGTRAYHANKRLTPLNPKLPCQGTLNIAADVRERRSQSGMAVEVKTGKLLRQEKLSAEAIDEVIGRQI